MSIKRIDQINELISRELNKIILKDIEFPVDVFVTIMAVRVATDLKHGKVWISVFPVYKRGQILRLLNKKS